MANNTGTGVYGNIYARDANGYNIELVKVNQIINEAFKNNYTGNPPGTGTPGNNPSGYLTPCEEQGVSNPADCDETASTSCGGC